MKKDNLLKVFSKIPVLETPRLTLRRLRTEDYKNMYEYAKLEDITKYLTWYPHEDEKFTYRYLEYIQTRYRAGDFYDWAVVNKANNKMIGTCGFTKFDIPNNSAEIGYVLNPEYWGQGIASEAVKVVLKFGFINLNLHRIEARYMQENNKSRKVMERCGMVFEGIHRSSFYIKDKYQSIGMCAILSDEYIKTYI